MKRVKVLLLGLLVTTAAALAQGGWTVMPGKGVGPLALDMSPSQVGAQLTATEYIGGPRNPKYVRYGDDILVEYASNRAVLITLNKATVNTKAGAVKWTPFNGAGIGTAWTAAESVLGRGYISRDLKVGSKEPRQTYYAYASKGLGFRTKAGVIVQVDVFASH
jgi:hypothetical protein